MRLRLLIRVLLFVCLLTGVSQAQLLGLTPGFPQGSYTSGPLTYDGTSTLALTNAPASQISLDPRSSARATITNGQLSIQIQVNSTTGALIPGTSTPSDVVLNGTVVLNGITYTSPLITGSVSAMGWQSASFGPGVISFDIRFTNLAGSLAHYFQGKDLAVTVKLDANPTNKTFNAFTGFPSGSFGATAQGNFGAIPGSCSGAIGDYVWRDSNGNGLQDPGEVGISGVFISLQDGSGLELVGTTTGPNPNISSQNGYYQFTGLCAGDYTVAVDATSFSSGTEPSPSLVGSDISIDSDPNPEVVSLPTDSSVNETIDFGFVPPSVAQIGGIVYLDLNANGTHDPGEPGLDGVTVSLFNPRSGKTYSTITNPQGIYLFAGDELEPVGGTGTNYPVTVNSTTLPPGLTATSPSTGSLTIHLPNNNTQILTANFGYSSGCTGAIGDFVWHDLNHNGIQDAGEPGIDGIELTLTDSHGNMQHASTYSPAPGQHGYYQFAGLCADTYTVSLTVPSPFTLSPPFQGGNPATDSNPNPSTVTLSTNSSVDETIDFGLSSPCSGTIGDFVWNDLNGNGIQEVGEPGLAGWTVNLHLASDYSLVGTTTTDANGIYHFYGRCAVPYKVEVVPQAGWVASPSLQGNNTAIDSNPNPSPVLLPSDGGTDNTIDFGFQQVGSIGILVWNDQNGNGVADSGEPGLSSVTLTLYDASNNPIGTTTTDSNGNYNFTNLVAGTYTVCVTPSTLPVGFVETYDLDGLSTPNCATGTLSAGQNRVDFNFGYQEQNGSIGILVWNDQNGNGVADNGEPGFSNVTLTLSQNNTVVATTTTNGSGNYSFTGLAAGTYTVCVTTGIPSGFVQTYGLSGLTNCATGGLTAGQNRVDFNFGYQEKDASVGILVWNDQNGNGVADSGEPGLQNVTLTLTQGSTTIGTTSTNASGNYLFSNLAAGTYMICTSNVPAGFVETYDLDGLGTPNCATFTLTAGQHRVDVNFGYQEKDASVGILVWNDQNGNGVADSGEPGLQNVTLTLTQGSTTIGTTSTNASGNYLFSNLAAGTYMICTSNVPAGFVETYDLDGLGTPNCATFTLTPGQNRVDVNFGYQEQDASVGILVWNDQNGNGVADSGEPGLQNVTLTLTQGSTTIGTTSTNASGNYLFSNLAAGTYMICTSNVPAGFVETYDLDGLGTPNCATFTLTAGQHRVDVNFGYQEKDASVGILVWNDQNGNGVADSGEPGLQNVTLTLTQGSTTIGTTSTNASGNYLFSNLAAGTYMICTSNVPAGFVETYDLDGLGTPNCATFTLTAGQHRVDVNFGYQEKDASVGILVWNDQNGNGVADSGEPGLQNVTLTLTQGSTTIGTTSTNASGNYLFSNLAAGTYMICTSNVPAGFVETYDLDGLGTPNCATFTLTAGQHRVDVNFGYQQRNGSIGILVWNDVNANGVQDSGEAGLSSVMLTLSQNNVVIATTGTNGNGNYSFGGLAAGTYTVCVTSGVPAGWVETYDLDGLGTPNCATGSLAAGQNRVDFNFGYRNPPPVLGSIGVLVWNDQNGNGLVDSGEPGLNNVTLVLSQGSTVLASTVTNSLGNYLFPNLPAGTYTVCVVSSTLPGGFAETYDLDGLSTPNCATGTLAAGQNRVDFNFGYQKVCAQPGSNAANFNGTAINTGSYIWFNANLTATGVPTAGTRLYFRNGNISFTANGVPYSIPVPNAVVIFSATATCATTTYDAASQTWVTTVPVSGSDEIFFAGVAFPVPTTLTKIGSVTWDGIFASSTSGLSVNWKWGAAVYTNFTTNYNSLGVKPTHSASCAYANSDHAGTPESYKSYVTGGATGGGGSNWTGSWSGTKSVTINCNCTTLTTVTQGGWGAPPHGGNPGMLLQTYFNSVYPNGVKIGGNNTLTFTSAGAVRGFLPQGGTPGVLNASATNPTSSSAGVFAGQVLALQLNVDFSSIGVTTMGLGGVKLTSGPLSGYTVAQVLALANQVIGGNTAALPAGMGVSDLNNVVDGINNMFDANPINCGSGF